MSHALARLEEALRPGAVFDPARDLRRISVAMRYELEPMVLPALASALRAAAPQARFVSPSLA